MKKLLFALLFPFIAYAQPVDVVRVVDGDTFIGHYYVIDHQTVQGGLSLSLEATAYIRVIGVDTPELHGKCASEKSRAVAAKIYVKALLKSGKVEISSIKADAYPGRVDAVVTVDGVDIAGILIDKKYGRVYTKKIGRKSWCE